MSRAPVFKPTFQNQRMLLPPSLDELIPDDHLARLVNRFVEGADESVFIMHYKGGGTSSYDPKMLAKVIVYAYLCKEFSGRQMAKLVRENIVFMWLAGLSTPDFRTINRFRSSRFAEGLKTVFKEVITYCLDQGLVGFESYFVDGTKLEANTNKHKVIWKKNNERYKGRVEEKLIGLFREIDAIIADEERDSEKTKREAERRRKVLKSPEAQAALNDALERINALSGKEKKHATKLAKESQKLIERQKGYEANEERLAGRSSCSKTDGDAVVMKMKNDEFRPGYNVMAGSENQFILHYSIYNNSGDSGCFVDHMTKFHEFYGRHCRQVIGDAAFGSEENYSYAKGHEIEAFLKYGSFYRETRRNWKPQFVYDAARDKYTCSEGKLLHYKETKRARTKTGFLQTSRIYECKACHRCPNRCTEAKRRTVQRNEALEAYRAEAHRRLRSPQGLELRSRRGVEIESSFGDIKQNFGFRRFHVRGWNKVEVETGLIFLAHNINKIGQRKK